MRTLIVEDDFVGRRLLQALLVPYGPCDVAVNGREAVQAFQMAHQAKEPYDLVCLDIMMPEMDGHAVLEEIRNVEASLGIAGTSECKVIMTTALSDFESIMGAFRRQCEAYLVKPIVKAKLLEKVRELGLIP